jgi:hypothetical protein
MEDTLSCISARNQRYVHAVVEDRHQLVVDVGAIQQEHICKGTPVLVLAVCIESDIFPEDQP